MMDDPECVDTSFLILFGQISVGALKLESKTVQSRGLPAAICLSLGKSASAQQVLQEGHRFLFPSDVDDAKFYLRNSKGQKISGMIEGVPWTLEEFSNFNAPTEI